MYCLQYTASIENCSMIIERSIITPGEEKSFLLSTSLIAKNISYNVTTITGYNFIFITEINKLCIIFSRHC